VRLEGTLTKLWVEPVLAIGIRRLEAFCKNPPGALQDCSLSSVLSSHALALARMRERTGAHATRDSPGALAIVREDRAVQAKRRLVNRMSTREHG